MKTPEQLIKKVFKRWQKHVAPAWGWGTYTPSDDQFAEMAAEAINADRAQITAALREDNPIVTAYLANVLDPSDDDGPDIAALWVHYIDEGDIGFDYTERQAREARAFITKGTSRWKS